MAKELLSIRLPEETKDKLDKLIKSTGRTKTFLVLEALEGYIETQSWQIEAIQEGIEAADRGDFIEHEDLLKSWKEKL